MRVLIIGKGAVGSAIGSMIKAAGYEVHYYDPFDENLLADLSIPYDICHITFPMVDKEAWEENVNFYMKQIICKFWIIESSIIPESLDIISKYLVLGQYMVYSPIRSTESQMLKMLKRQKKFFAFVNVPHDPDTELKFLYYMNSVFHNVIRFNDAKALAYGKLIEVADFGMQITFAQMVYFECMRGGYSFDEVYSQYRKYAEYGADYNKLKKGTPMKWIPRAIFRPDVIKGKCVIQDIDLMSGGYGLWEWIKQLNNLTKGYKEGMEELKNAKKKKEER